MPHQSRNGGLCNPFEVNAGARQTSGSRRMGAQGDDLMIRKLASGKYRLYSRKKDPKTGKRRNLGTFNSRAAAQKHERDVQYFKRH
jgi:hypothetical protein